MSRDSCLSEALPSGHLMHSLLSPKAPSVSTRGSYIGISDLGSALGSASTLSSNPQRNSSSSTCHRCRLSCCSLPPCPRRLNGDGDEMKTTIFPLDPHPSPALKHTWTTCPQKAGRRRWSCPTRATRTFENPIERLRGKFPVVIDCRMAKEGY